MDKAEASQVLPLVIGRLFRIASRPEEDGDTQVFFQLRSLALDAAEALELDMTDDRPNWARDQNKGAQGG